MKKTFVVNAGILVSAKNTDEAEKEVRKLLRNEAYSVIAVPSKVPSKGKILL